MRLSGPQRIERTELPADSAITRRFIAPLTISEADMATGIKIFKKALQEVAKEG